MSGVAIHGFFEEAQLELGHGQAHPASCPAQHVQGGEGRGLDGLLATPEEKGCGRGRTSKRTCQEEQGMTWLLNSRCKLLFDMAKCKRVKKESWL